MNWFDFVVWGFILSQVLLSSAHDHLYLIGEKRTTYFAWTRTKFSPLIQWLDIIKKGDAATAKADERKKRNRP